VLAPRLESGYHITGVTDDGWYVLTESQEDP
jgi:hypothetical protein